MNQRNAFTLIEMMAVIFILGLIAGYTALAFDLTGQRTQYELEEFRSLFKVQLSRSLRTGEATALTYHPETETIRKDNSVVFRFRYWEIVDPTQNFTVHLSPSGVAGPDRISLKSRGDHVEFTPDRISGIRRTEGAGND